MSNCLFEATLQKIEKDCNCTPKYFVDIVEGFEPCEGKQKQCMNIHMAEMGDQRSVWDNGDYKVCFDEILVTISSLLWYLSLLFFCLFVHMS